MLKGKTIVLGVAGGIAAFKIASLASMLVKQGAKVQVIMTEHACEFIAPLTFEAITKTRCLTDTFDRNHEYSTEHISIAKQADAFLIAPATANVIAKVANGLADDMLTTTFLACQCPKIIAPAMNTQMYENVITQDNIKKLKQYGMQVIDSRDGWLACGDSGAGRMPEPEELLDYIMMACGYEKDLTGKKILVTAGPTQESIDPVRYITNHSSGKMGYSIAKIAALRGAEVTLVTGKTGLKTPSFVQVVPVTSAKDMFEEVTSRSEEMDIIIKAAAVADYTPKVVADEKMKKSGSDLSIELERTNDILAYLGEHKKEGQFLCGFAMETQNLLENAALKLERKNADMIVANSLRTAGAGFGTDTNQVTFLTKKGQRALELMSKEEVAGKILDEILKEL